MRRCTLFGRCKLVRSWDLPLLLLYSPQQFCGTESEKKVESTK